MKLLALICFVSAFSHLSAQELFTFSEPASNMAAKGFGFRVTNNLAKQSASDKYEYRLLPEIMWGVSGKIMIHAEGFFSKEKNSFGPDGGALYLKYRFISRDEIHSHFRTALYARASLNNSAIDQPAIDLNGKNSGCEAGLIATKLANRTAFSAGSSFIHAANNGAHNKFFYGDKNRNALAYNLSAGRLMLPLEYVSYKQLNVNVMLEVLGQFNFGAEKNFLDLGSAIQFIILSRMRIDAGYRFAVVKDVMRTAPGGFLLRLEYNIFNAYK